MTRTRKACIALLGAIVLATTMGAEGCQPPPEKKPATMQTPRKIGEGGVKELDPKDPPVIHPQDVFDWPEGSNPFRGIEPGMNPEPQPKHDAEPVPILTDGVYGKKIRKATFFASTRPDGVPLRVTIRHGTNVETFPNFTGPGDFEQERQVKPGEALSMTVTVNGPHQVRAVSDHVCMIAVKVIGYGAILIDFDQVYGHIEPKACVAKGNAP